MSERADKPWSDVAEDQRQGYINAGLEPKLHGYWADLSTESLRASYEECSVHPDLADTTAELLIEIRYRTDHLHEGNS